MVTASVKKVLALTAAVLALAGGGCAAGESVTVLQNGVLPTPEYSGCVDTAISGNRYEANRDNSRRQTLSCGPGRNVLIRFDLTPIPKDHVIHRALLRVADAGYPRRSREGAWPVHFLAYRLTRAWNDKACWEYHSRKSYRDQPQQAKWKTPGGDFDRETDFGRGKGGLVGSEAVLDGAWGHMHELDVTPLVKAWHEGQLPNYGLALCGQEKGPHFSVASSEWYVPDYRPKLVVAHGAKGSEPTEPARLSAAPKKVELDPISATPDAGRARGEYGVVRVGQNANCLLRGASTDAYVKEAVSKYPGRWGWMGMCRVGGAAGDFSRALLYFDLSGIPKDASIRRARLRVWLTPYTNRQVGSYRYGAFLLKLPASPGWKAEEVTAAQREEGRAWPGGGVLAASEARPLAIGRVVQVERTVRGRKRKVPGAMEFDLTGAVRAWVQGKALNCGIALDNRLEGGAYDFYSSRWPDPELRPYLEVELSPAPAGRPAPIHVEAGLPDGDYWVGPMREAHKRFDGKPGTLAQYGDSITVTMAFLAYRFAAGAPRDITPPRKELALANTPPEVAKELEVVAKYSDRGLWWRWKGGQWGCTGQMKSDWFLANIDGWQKKMNPEVGVILFGTNDLGGLCPPDYTENMAAGIRRMLQDGTVPMLTTVPPKSGGADLAEHYNTTLASIARHFKIPVIDYYGEIMRRRPDDWDGRMEKFRGEQGEGKWTLISRDGVHPSHPGKYAFDFSEEALSNNGYVLRDYLTLRKYYEVITKVLRPGAD